MLSIVRRLLKCQNGSLAVEYTLIASLVAVAAISAMTAVGNKPERAAASAISRTN
ncbi:MAG: Flp family type IVb pilin [Alphaproteobacteria bacterium]|nr:Flp family type IVb pilin [Alphaproteobacteria bacterium]